MGILVRGNSVIYLGSFLTRLQPQTHADGLYLGSSILLTGAGMYSFGMTHRVGGK